MTELDIFSVDYYDLDQVIGLAKLCQKSWLGESEGDNVVVESTITGAYVVCKRWYAEYNNRKIIWEPRPSH